MRHHRKTLKLGRTTAHRDAMLANQVCSLIEHRRIKTTLAKAKAARSLAEKMVTLGKKGTLHARRIAISYLRDKERVKKLFEQIAPAAAERQGGYTRIIKLGPRQSDSAPMALLEWVDEPALVSDAVIAAEVTSEKKKSSKEEKPEVVEEVQEAPLEEEVEGETTA